MFLNLEILISIINCVIVAIFLSFCIISNKIVYNTISFVISSILLNINNIYLLNNNFDLCILISFCIVNLFLLLVYFASIIKILTYKS